VHIFFYTINKNIIFNIFKAVDFGGSMVIHIFGAYFGLACTYFFKPKVAIEDKKRLD